MLVRGRERNKKGQEKEEARARLENGKEMKSARDRKKSPVSRKATSEESRQFWESMGKRGKVCQGKDYRGERYRGTATDSRNSRRKRKHNCESSSERRKLQKQEHVRERGKTYQREGKHISERRGIWDRREKKNIGKVRVREREVNGMTAGRKSEEHRKK